MKTAHALLALSVAAAMAIGGPALAVTQNNGTNNSTALPLPEQQGAATASATGTQDTQNNNSTALPADKTQTAATNPAPENDPAKDDSGFLALGVDISGAGNTPDTVKTFVADLSAEQQTGLSASCKGILAGDMSMANANVVLFCKNFTGTM